jgi:hypothetical protein
MLSWWMIAVLKGIQNLIRYEVPFAIAPTIYEGNLHEINDIVRFAYGNGGFFAPNHLRKFPHAPHVLDISLKPESLRKCILETTAIIEKEFKAPVQPSDLKGLFPAPWCDYGNSISLIYLDSSAAR